MLCRVLDKLSAHLMIKREYGLEGCQMDLMVRWISFLSCQFGMLYPTEVYLSIASLSNDATTYVDRDYSSYGESWCQYDVRHRVDTRLHSSYKHVANLHLDLRAAPVVHEEI